ncbi:MAG: hypothetical protein ACXWQO_13325 [Bdellovibrionota bacterium]
MKFALPLLALLISGSSPAMAARSLFTPFQERKVLEGIQAACNNTWCEGDFGYEFNKFHCEKSSCKLDLNIILYKKHDGNGHPILDSAERHAVVCAYTPVKRLSDVLNPKKAYVSEKYFKSLATCIDLNASVLGEDEGWAPDPQPQPDMPLPVEVQNIPAADAVPDSANAIFPALNQ